MTALDRARLRRLQRLTRLRAIEKDLALRDVAESEAALARLIGLAERTTTMAASYQQHPGESDGAALAAVMRFERGLGTLAQAAKADAGNAQGLADLRQQSLAQAERRRAVIADHADAAGRMLQSRAGTVPTGARRAFGTGLEG